MAEVGRLRPAESNADTLCKTYMSYSQDYGYFCPIKDTLKGVRVPLKGLEVLVGLV